MPGLRRVGSPLLGPVVRGVAREWRPKRSAREAPLARAPLEYPSRDVRRKSAPAVFRSLHSEILIIEYRNVKGEIPFYEIEFLANLKDIRF